ncbi:MAG: signal peptidase I [Clostridiales bacterium]
MELVKKIKNPAVRETVDWIIHIGIAIIIAIFITKFVFQRTVVYKISMQPTLKEGDNLIVEKISPKINNIDKGDIITVYSPEYVHEKGNTMIKRVIAVEGDTIKIDDGKVYVNDKVIKEDYILGDYTDNSGEYIEEKIKEDHVYVLGDNREEKIIDSREAGQIKMENVSGKAVMRVFPFNKFELF